MRKSIVTVLAALSLTGVIATPAVAADEPSVTISIEDLNLGTPAGEALLTQRIEAAVKSVCEKPDMRDLKATAAWEACKAEARSGAFEQLSILEPFERIELASVF